MFTPYWSMTQHDATMNDIELGFLSATDESSAIMHRFVKAFGIQYDITHNYWGSPNLDPRYPMKLTNEYMDDLDDRRNQS